METMKDNELVKQEAISKVQEREARIKEIDLRINELRDEILMLSKERGYLSRQQNLTNNEVFALHEQGLSIVQIAKALGVSRERVRQRLKQYRLRRATNGGWSEDSIHNIGLPIKISNSLSRNGLRTIGDLEEFIEEYGADRLLSFSNFGRQSLEALLSALPFLLRDRS